MKKIFTLFVATAMLLSAQAVTVNRAQIKHVGFAPAARADVQNLAANQNGTNFDITVHSVAVASADVTIAPKAADTYWYFTAAPAEYYDQVTPASYTAYLKNYIDENYGAYIQYGMATYDMFLIQDSYRDTLSGLEPNTEYVVMAWGIDPTTFTATTEFDTAHIHTLEGQMSDNVITMAYANGTLAVSATNNDPYFFIMESLEDYQYYEDDFSQASLKDEANAWVSGIGEKLPYFIYEGNQNIDVLEFYTTYMAEEMPNGDYVALACGHNGEYINTAVTYAQFTYAATAVENVNADVKAVKSIKNGQIVIEHNGVKYNVLGTEMK